MHLHSRLFGQRELFFAVVVSAVLIFSAQGVSAADAPGKGPGVFPVFGEGPVEVRIYASYFCPPCRSLEPVLEPVLEELVDAGKIRVIFVDLPVGPAMPYIRHFLYALNNDKSMKNAFHVRHILFDLAKKDGDADDIREAFEKEGISYEPFDTKEIFMTYNQYLKEDYIRRTPSASIRKDGTSITHMGGGNILSALEDLKNDKNGDGEK